MDKRDNVTNIDAYRQTPSATAPLQQGGGGGTSDGMDTNIQRLDDKIDNRFFWLLGIFGAGFVLLATLILSTTDKLATKIDGVSDQVAQVGQRVAKLEGAAETKPPPISAPAVAK